MKSEIKEPVKLRQKKLANGNQSLYLDIYYNGQREYEFLKLYLIPEKSREDKERNRQTLSLANTIKAERVVEIQRGNHGFGSRRKGKMSFFRYCQNMADEYLKNKQLKTHSIWMSFINHLHAYEARDITFDEVTPKWVKGFAEYLKTASDMRWRHIGRTLSQSSINLYLSKLTCALKRAVEDDIITKSPAVGLKTSKSEETERSYLTIDEVRILAATDCRNTSLKSMFLFSCLTGLRFSDITKLRWVDVSEVNGRRRLTFTQQKTKGHEYLDITPQAAELMGERRNDGAFVFNDDLHHNSINRQLKIWVGRAGINKHITFHCGRHTFAVMMLTLGTDIYTVSKLLGHRDLKTTQIYARIVDSKKQEAVDNIPRIF